MKIGETGDKDREDRGEIKIMKIEERQEIKIMKMEERQEIKIVKIGARQEINIVKIGARREIKIVANPPIDRRQNGDNWRARTILPAGKRPRTPSFTVRRH